MPPKNGIFYLSVGYEKINSKLQKIFKKAEKNNPQIFVITADYGEGKSHLLRFTQEFSKMFNFASVYVTHDKSQNVGFHKPGWLLRRILWELRWSYPHLNLDAYYHFMKYFPTYWEDRFTRTTLAQKLEELCDYLQNHGFHGLSLFIDEVENSALLHWSQDAIAREVIERLLHGLLNETHFPLVLFLSSTSYNPYWWIFDKYGIVTYPISSFRSELNGKKAYKLARRIWSIHAKAFNWEPT
ncbi:MAG: hypothetical protein ACTSUK_01470, partial [Promethearchaeota archaeon]